MASVSEWNSFLVLLSLLLFKMLTMVVGSRIASGPKRYVLFFRLQTVFSTVNCFFLCRWSIYKYIRLTFKYQCFLLWKFVNCHEKKRLSPCLFIPRDAGTNSFASISPDALGISNKSLHNSLVSMYPQFHTLSFIQNGPVPMYPQFLIPSFTMDPLLSETIHYKNPKKKTYLFSLQYKKKFT